MCGRYYVNEEAWARMRESFEELPEANPFMHFGDVTRRCRRCVLPASGFYEWDRSKEKVTFTLTGEPVIYLAGIYRPYGPENRFVIITREANESMLPVHDRMPLMISPQYVRDWLHDTDRMRNILQEPLPQLLAKRDYEQLSLF